MAENIVASLVTGPVTPNAPKAYLGRLPVQIVKLIGTATAPTDTSNALSLGGIGKNPIVICPGYSYAISSGAITFTAIVAQGSTTAYVLVIYDESPPGGGF